LFINKDATNLNRTQAEAFAIGSHTSKAYRKWAKSERLRRIGVTAFLPQSTGTPLKICPRAQSPLFEERDEIEEAANPQTVAALLKAVIHQYRSAQIKSSIPPKITFSNIHGRSPSLYRAMEYCMASRCEIDVPTNTDQILVMRVLVPNNTPVYGIFDVSNVNCLVSTGFLN